MQAQNVKEYELIRGEMTNLKECVTKYVGYVFGGAGAAIYGLGRMDMQEKGMGVAFVSFSLSMLINFVLLILFYKFYSHNRFAGYCKVLNHERYAAPAEKRGGVGCVRSFCGRVRALLGSKNRKEEPEDELLSWEVVVGTMRTIDWTREADDLYRDARMEAEKDRLTAELRMFLARDKWKGIKGLLFLLSTPFRRDKYGSWGFPPYITALVILISLSFAALASYFSVVGKIRNYPAILSLFWATWAGFNYFFMRKLYALMEGSSTVEAFYLKILPIRAAFLNRMGIEPRYIVLDLVSKRS